MPNKELKPCPFCGGKAILHENDWCEPTEWSVHCSKCQSGPSGRKTSKQAIKIWNKRVEIRE